MWAYKGQSMEHENRNIEYLSIFRAGVCNMSIQGQEYRTWVFKSMVWNVTYKGTWAWSINHSKKGVLMQVFKGRSIECEYSRNRSMECEYLRAMVWDMSIQGQEYGLGVFKNRGMGCAEYSRTEVWNVSIQGQEFGMWVFKGRRLECEYSRAWVWNVSIERQENGKWVWNVSILGKDYGMWVFKGRSMEC